jgi:nucleolar pre-ribosomal-associated protein 2
MCQLTGRLTHEMKAALEPGIYAVLNVMTKEGMRTMNAALDESGRAVWKGLYEEWRRFGN